MVKKESEEPKKRLMLIGWDAADWRVIEPLLDAGKMPHLQGLIERGVMGNLSTLQPVLSPMLWTSIATGKRPYKHGVHGFSEPDPVTGGVRPVTNLSRRTKALWNILHQEGKFPAVVGWWPSHPCEPMSNGVMVSNHYQRISGKNFDSWSFDPASVHPPRLHEVMKEIRFHPSEIDQELVTMFLPYLATVTDQKELDEIHQHPRLRGLCKIISDTTTVHSAATAIAQNEPWDFLAVYHDAIDHYGHGFMKYHPPRRDWVPEEEYKVWKDVIESGYRYADLQLGTMLHLAGEDTTVMLISDHGFHPDEMRLQGIPDEPAGPAHEHRQLGIFVAAGPDIRSDERIYGASLLDIAPTILHHFGLPVGEDVDGRVLHDIWKEEAKREEERIASWDEVEGDAGTHPEGTQISPVDSKAALDQLAALGYIEEPDADKSKALEQTVRELEYNLACAYVDGGIYSEAIVLLERLLAKWPMEHRFGSMLAVCYRALGRNGDLRDVTTVLLERRTQDAMDAREELKALNLDDPGNQKAEKDRVEAMSEEEKQKFQRERQKVVARANPNLFSLLFQQAYADFADKDYGNALARLQELDSDFGSRLKALCLRGDIYLRKREWESAREAYAAALELDSEAPGPYLGMARAALGERDYGQAIELVTRSIGILYHQPRAHFLRGMAFYRDGRFNEAEEAFRTALDQAPLMAGAYRMLGQIARYHHQNSAAYTSLKVMGIRARKQARELRHGEVEAAQNESDATTAPMEALPPLLPRPMALNGVPESEVITIVSGLPRSGTSLMMQILQALEIPIFTDGERDADVSNQRGYFEHRLATKLLTAKGKDWLLDTRGHALKLVAPHLRAVPSALPGADGAGPIRLRMRLIYMVRPIEQVLASQSAMLKSLGKKDPPGDIAKAYRQQEISARRWATRMGVPALEIDYAELISNPKDEALRLLGFLNRGVEQVSLVSDQIAPELFRERSLRENEEPW